MKEMVITEQKEFQGAKTKPQAFPGERREVASERKREEKTGKCSEARKEVRKQ